MYKIAAILMIVPLACRAIGIGTLFTGLGFWEDFMSIWKEGVIR